MAVTRSSNKPRQAQIEDFPTTKDPAKKAPTSKRASKGPNQKASETTNTSKRKAPLSGTKSDTPAKKAKSESSSSAKQAHFTSNGTSSLEKPIIINRSPVLHLWSAVVASLTHPDLSWSACLNIGSAISTLCAVSKGKATGMIEAPDRTEEEQAQRKDKKQKTVAESKHVKVMGFELPLKGDAIILSGQTTSAKEGNPIGKFGGDETYNKVKGQMRTAGSSWEGKWDDFDKSAFKMYEKFRPTVPQGQKGWGRKGELNLAEVGHVIKTQ